MNTNRSTYINDLPEIEPMKVGDVVIDPERSKVVIKDKTIQLRRKEFDLFNFLIANRERVLSRQIILDNVWGVNYNPFSNTLDMHISSLKKKINTPKKRLLETVYGTGYKVSI